MSYNRNAETQRRLKKKYRPCYRCPIYFDDEKERWIHYELCGRRYRAYLKRKCNKRVRQTNEVYQQPSKYKRHSNFWNELV